MHRFFLYIILTSYIIANAITLKNEPNKYNVLRDQVILANVISLKNIFKNGQEDYIFSPAGIQLSLSFLQFTSSCPNKIKGLLPPEGCGQLSRALKKVPKSGTTDITHLKLFNVIYIDGMKYRRYFDYRIDENIALFSAHITRSNLLSNTAPSKIVSLLYRQKTHGYFHSPEHLDTVSSKSAFMIGGSMNFRSLWSKEFDILGLDTFYGINGQVSIPMIVAKDMNFQYGQYPELRAQIIAIPFKKKYKMIYILPNDSNVTRLELNLKSQPNVFHQFSKRKYPVYHGTIQVPYMDMQTNLNLLNIFSKELSCHKNKIDLLFGIDGKPASEVLNLSHIYHNTRFSVTPLGAGTSTDILETSYVDPLETSSTPAIIINRPHLFFVIEEKKSILFKGRFANPPQYVEKVDPNDEGIIDYSLYDDDGVLSKEA